MTIYLFGDSYVEHEPPVERTGWNDHERWDDILRKEQDEHIVNYGVCGQGPIQSMQKFQDCLEDGVLHQEKVVMVLSHPMRIPWKFLRGELDRDRCIVYKGEKIGDPSSMFGDFFENPDRIHPKLRNSIKDLYDCMWEELSRSNYKNVCYLSHMSKTHSIQMIVFTVYHVQDAYSQCRGVYPQINTSDLIYNLEALNTDNFFYYNTPLYEYSKYDEAVYDNLINHLSVYNHTILSNVISNFFYGTNYDTKFSKPTNEYDEDHIDFIYD
tara:strand:+ start:93 stop:896 length:804 start_codon:yes stop_codon:yes gene_type:complete